MATVNLTLRWPLLVENMRVAICGFGSVFSNGYELAVGDGYGNGCEQSYVSGNGYSETPSHIHADAYGDGWSDGDVGYY